MSPCRDSIYLEQRWLAVPAVGSILQGRPPISLQLEQRKLRLAPFLSLLTSQFQNLAPQMPSAVDLNEPVHRMSLHA